MKSLSTPAVNSLKNDYAVSPDLVVLAEWNMNRYVTPTVSVNQDNTYGDSFPLETVVAADRPTRSGVVRSFFDNLKFVNQGDEVLYTRNYFVDEDDVYKYWVSRPATSRFGTSGYGFDTNPEVTVMYSEPVKTNKIVVLVENGFNNITGSQLMAKFDINGGWIPVGGQLGFNSYGRATIYLNNLWQQIPGDYKNRAQNIYGLKLVIDSVGTPNLPAAVIEISPRYEVEISEDVISTSSSEEMSDPSRIAPIGNASSNTGTIALSNTDQKYNNDNPESPFYKILDKNVKIAAFIGIETGEGFDYVNQLTMFSESWNGQQGEEVSVSLSDSSRAMQNMIIPKVFLQNETVGRIIATLCDLTGFTNYQYWWSSQDQNQKLEYFWTTGEDTLWSVIDNLSQGTQTAVFFDATDTLQIKTRSSALNVQAPSSWTFDYARSGIKLPDILEYTEEIEYDANVVEVLYNPTATSDFNNGTPKMEVSWEPEDTMVIRAGILTYPMDTNSTTFRLPSANAAYWPYEGVVNIDSELIRYKGKSYVYYINYGVTGSQMISSDEEKERLDQQSHPDLAWKNAFDGFFKITERGYKDTLVLDHSQNIRPGNAFLAYIVGDNVYGGFEWGGGISSGNSICTLATNSDWDDQHNYVVRANSTNSAAYLQPSHIGTRIRFPEGRSPDDEGEAGLFAQQDVNSFGGYYCALRPTAVADAGDRDIDNELVVWYKPTNGGNNISLASIPLEIFKGKWYDLDMTIIENVDQSHTINVAVDGVPVASCFITRADAIKGTRHGFHVGGHTVAEFEYHYASNYEPGNGPDNSTFFDAARGGFSSGYVMRQWYNYGYRTMELDTNYFETYRTSTFFEDFGSIVHEVLEMEVDFETPVIYSKPYFTNDKVFCASYVGSPFGAKMVLMNASRTDEVLKGEDDQTFGAENSVNQEIFIYGRAILQGDEQKIISRDEPTIRKRGEVKTQFSNQWNQNKASSQSLADWVVKQWRGGNQTVTLESFGNPLMQIGDVVTVNYVTRNIINKKFFVVGINTEYNNGITTTFYLHSVNL